MKIFSSISSKIIKYVIAVLIIGFGADLLDAQTKYEYDAIARWRIETPAKIDSILTGLMLPKESPQAIEIVDINGNGIDNVDLLIISPASDAKNSAAVAGGPGTIKSYVIGDLLVPESVRKIIQNIELGSNAELKITVTSLEDLKELWKRLKNAYASVAVTTMTALMQNYPETDYTFIVQRRPNGDFIFRMIGFDEEKTTPQNPWDSDSTMTVLNQNEVLRMFLKNVEEKLKPEVIIIEKTRVDTVYLNRK